MPNASSPGAGDQRDTPAIGGNTIVAARGLGILAVVLGHVGSFYALPHMYHWHIPLFFFLVGSGLLVRHPLLATLRHVFVDIILYLWIWTVIYGLTLRLIEPAIPEANYRFAGEPWLRILSVDILTMNSHAIGFLAPCWFLLAYAAMTLICTLLSRVLPAASLAPIGVLALVGGWQIGTPEGYSTGQWATVLTGQTLLATGYCLIGSAFFRSATVQRLALAPLAGALSLLMMLWLLSAFNPRMPNIAWMALDPNILVSSLVTFAGIHLVILLAHALAGWKQLRLLGGQSKAIMTHHLLGFAALNMAMVATGAMTIDGINSYSVAYPEIYWPAYLALGLLVPLAISSASTRLRKALTTLAPTMVKPKSPV